MSTKANIYQAIWDADQGPGGNGIRAIRKDDSDSPRDENLGYVIVDEVRSQDEDHKVLPECVIPQSKIGTYDKCAALFNNYELTEGRGSNRENVTVQEDKEVDDFITAIKDTPTMQTAREYLGKSEDEWAKAVKDDWFTMSESSRGRSGFEHCFVGEDTGKVGGYHYWHKFFLDDGGNGGTDTIKDNGARYRALAKEGLQNPEVVTISFSWDAYVTPNNPIDDLEKAMGGFWVGCSPEGLMALGMVCLADKPKTDIVINDAKYQLKLFELNNVKAINTFYPIFKGPIGERPDASTGDEEKEEKEDETGDENKPDLTPASGSVRIICALINPVGADKGKETVTLVNVTRRSVGVNGWAIEDRNRNTFKLDGTLNAGEVKTFTLSGDDAQFGNKGDGKIILKDADKKVVDEKSYRLSSKDKEGSTIIL